MDAAAEDTASPFSFRRGPHGPRVIGHVDVLGPEYSDLWGWSVLNLLRLSVFFFRIVQIHVIPLISWGKKNRREKTF